MGNCKIATFTPEGKIVYSCDGVRQKMEFWKSEFRKNNGTASILSAGGRDRSYERYCMQFDDILSKCKCNDIALKCEKCASEDHKGYFCRCEMRNIALAKQLREKGMSPWQKDNKAEGESHRERLSEKTSKEGAIV